MTFTDVIANASGLLTAVVSNGEDLIASQFGPALFIPIIALMTRLIVRTVKSLLLFGSRGRRR